AGARAGLVSRPGLGGLYLAGHPGGLGNPSPRMGLANDPASGPINSLARAMVLPGSDGGRMPSGSDQHLDGNELRDIPRTSGRANRSGDSVARLPPGGSADNAAMGDRPPLCDAGPGSD